MEVGAAVITALVAVVVRAVLCWSTREGESRKAEVDGRGWRWSGGGHSRVSLSLSSPCMHSVVVDARGWRSRGGG